MSNDKHGHAHPTPKTFVTTGLILAAITAVEFGILYLEGFKGLVLTILFVLSAIKFYLVATVFMHLKFDNKFLGIVFAAGVILATLITIAQKYVNLA